MMNIVGILLLFIYGSTSGATISSTVLTTARTNALQRHNIYRENHKTIGLILDSSLTNSAQSYAQYLASQSVVGLVNSGTSGIGENLYMLYATYDLATESAIINSGVVASKAWYDEILKYDYNNPGFYSNTGDFTQLVWTNSTTVGFGIEKGYQYCDNSYATKCYVIYVVAHYNPPGNVLYGTNDPIYFKQCVLRPIKDLTDLPSA